MRANKIALSLALLLQLMLTIDAAPAQETETIDLFEPSTQRQGAPTGENVPGLRSGAVGAVTFFSLSPAARQSLRLTQSGERKMRIALPGGQTVTCVFAAQESGADTLDGTVEGSDSPIDRCDFVVTDGRIDGDIQLESGRYRIVPMEGGAHAVVELEPGAYPNEGDIPLPPLASGAQRKSDRSLRDAPRCDVPPRKELGPIRILVLYTPVAKAQTSNIRAEIKLAIQQLNDAFSKNGGNYSIKAELADMRPVSYVEADQTEVDGRQIAGMETDLDRLSGREPGYFNTIPALRDQYKADLVHLLVGYKETNPCGVGWMPPLDQIGPDTRDWAYSASQPACFVRGRRCARPEPPDEERAISVLIFDLDHFKGANDRFGHDLGDRVLKLFANTTSVRLNGTSLMARLGGEEFAAILPGANPLEVSPRTRPCVRHSPNRPPLSTACRSAQRSASAPPPISVSAATSTGCSAAPTPLSMWRSAPGATVSRSWVPTTRTSCSRISRERGDCAVSARNPPIPLSS